MLFILNKRENHETEDLQLEFKHWVTGVQDDFDRIVEGVRGQITDPVERQHFTRTELPPLKATQKEGEFPTREEQTLLELRRHRAEAQGRLEEWQKQVRCLDQFIERWELLSKKSVWERVVRDNRLPEEKDAFLKED